MGENTEEQWRNRGKAMNNKERAWKNMKHDGRTKKNFEKHMERTMKNKERAWENKKSIEKKTLRKKKT